MNTSTPNLPVRQEFNATEQLVVRETASSAVAAQAKAMVEARYVMALQRPRNWDQVRQSILHECRRPSFANNKSAYYKKPIGQGVEGLGIRFTEIALRCMTNVLIETSTIFEDTEKEIVRVSVTDLESNVTYPMDVRVTKTVERSKPMDDGTYLSVRMNSWKKPVYTVPANDDDLLNKRGALISKAQRTLALRIIPGDIQDEAEEIIKAIRMDEAARDPDAERKKIADAFSELGVKAADLTAYLGHGLDTCSPAELVNLRGIYGAIKDGEATWATVLENEDKEPPKDKPKGGVDGPTKKPRPWRDRQGPPDEPEPEPAGEAEPPAEEAPQRPTETKPEEQRKAKPHENVETAGAALIAKVRDRAARFGINEERILKHHGLTSLEGMTTGIANVIMAWLMAGAPEK